LAAAQLFEGVHVVFYPIKNEARNGGPRVTQLS
jgi:hypothetical protein